MSKVISWLAMGLALAVAGCAAKPKSVAVATGEVTIDGEAVDGGIISFIDAATDQPAAGAAVTGGRYTLYPESQLPPGDYKIEIRWSKSTGERLKEPVYGHSPFVFAEAIPARYNSESELKVELLEGANEVNFRLGK
ncbi:MAG: hypothetical protein ACKO9Z_04720 [Planctomycetota bacterium]